MHEPSSEGCRRIGSRLKAKRKDTAIASEFDLHVYLKQINDAPLLSPEEEKRGVQLGRVIFRVAGAQRIIPYRIMPDEADPTKFLLAKVDRQSGELMPLLRRGAKRYVTKNREGLWELD